MGWYYTNGGTRQGLIKELTQEREHTRPEGLQVKTTCLAHCYRGNVYSGVLWSVFEQRFFKDGTETESVKRWIGCDLMQCYKGNWGHKPMCEEMHPYFYSVPLGYLEMVPIETYGGNAEWRQVVAGHHAKQKAKRQAKKAGVQ